MSRTSRVTVAVCVAALGLVAGTGTADASYGTVHDTNGDGRIDQVSVDVNGDSYDEALLWDANGDGRLEWAFVDISPSHPKHFELAFVDHNGDGAIDYGMGDFGGSSRRETYIYPYGGGSWLFLDSNEDGRFEAQLFDQAGDGWYEWTKRDADGDGVADRWVSTTATSSTSGTDSAQQMLNESIIDSALLSQMWDQGWPSPYWP